MLSLPSIIKNIRESIKMLTPVPVTENSNITEGQNVKIGPKGHLIANDNLKVVMVAGTAAEIDAMDMSPASLKNMFAFNIDTGKKITYDSGKKIKEEVDESTFAPGTFIYSTYTKKLFYVVSRGNVVPIILGCEQKDSTNKPSESNLYLSFIEENSEPFTLKTNNASKNWNGTLEYSIDTQNWSEWNGVEINSSNDGKLYLRGTENNKISDNGKQFVLTDNKRIQCLGNIENLLDYKTVKAGSHPVMGTGCYKTMFYHCKSLTTVPELPVTTLAGNCYEAMFYGCDSLTKAPELPATTLAIGCYKSMFALCKSLKTAPELPATTLAGNCYEAMFYGCDSLTKAPELPATTLAIGCYDTMFYSCTSLTTAPELPATTLADSCYSDMFRYCDSLAGTIHCPASTASNTQRLDAKANIPANTAIVVYDL